MLLEVPGRPALSRMRVLDATTKDVFQEFESSFASREYWWSPDETRIAYITTLGKELAVYSLEDRKTEIVAKRCGLLRGITKALFVDNNRIAFTDSRAEGMGGYHLHLVNLTTGKCSLLYKHAYDFSDIQSIDDGRKIVLRTRANVPLE
jgi:hypothetical protein